MKKNQYRNTQHSPTVETVDDFVVPRNQGARLKHGQDGKVTRSYHFPSGKGTESAPVAPYAGKRIVHADRPN